MTKSNETLRSRMEALADRLNVLARRQDTQDRPSATDRDAEWHRALATAYSYAADAIREELAKEE